MVEEAERRRVSDGYGEARWSGEGKIYLLKERSTRCGGLGLFSRRRQQRQNPAKSERGNHLHRYAELSPRLPACWRLVPTLLLVAVALLTSFSATPARSARPTEADGRS